MTETHVNIKATTSYMLHLFCDQIWKTSHTQHLQAHQMQKKMMEIMTQKAQTNDFKDVVNKLIPVSTGKDIKKPCQSIHLLYNMLIRKVKMLKPRFELGNSCHFLVKVIMLENPLE